MTSPSDHALPQTLGPLFDEAWYAARYPEALASGLDPLAHYLAEGDATGNRPHPLFDPAFYSEQHPEIAKSAGARLKHYAEVGEPGGAWPNPLFDPRFYLEANPDLQPPTSTGPGSCGRQTRSSTLSFTSPSLARGRPVPTLWFTTWSRGI